MTNAETLNCVEIEPKQPANHSIIWLHGLGADGHDFVPIVSELQLPPDLNVRFIFPHAPIMPVTINNGYEMRAWFDITSLSSGGMVDQEGILASIDSVQKLIQRENKRGVTSQNILLAGFSQGGVIALCTGITYFEPLAGIVGLSTCLPQGNLLLQQASIANANVPIFLAHGTQDSMLPYALGESAHKLLADAKYPVTWHSYPIAHTVSQEEVQDLRTWLLHIWKINQK